MNSVNEYQENYGTGWISIYRSIKNHWIFENEKHLKWWLIMLFEVNHTEKKITRYYNVYDIKKGQSCNCLRTWANLFNCTPKTVSKFFKLLEKDNMINIEKIGKGKQALTLITITNYSNYQGSGKQGLLQDVNKEETRSKQTLPTNNNDNNYNNVNNDNKYLDSFSKFWDAYDKKTGKDKCYKKWCKLNESEINEILNTVEVYVKSTPDKNYRKNPLTYLNGRHWEDELVNDKSNVKGKDIIANLKKQIAY